MRGLVEDLFVHAWVPLMGAPNVVDLAEGSYTVESFESMTLEHPYSIIYLPP
jgi:hypothetical protein